MLYSSYTRGSPKLYITQNTSVSSLLWEISTGRRLLPAQDACYYLLSYYLVLLAAVLLSAVLCIGDPTMSKSHSLLTTLLLVMAMVTSVPAASQSP